MKQESKDGNESDSNAAFLASPARAFKRRSTRMLGSILVAALGFYGGTMFSNQAQAGYVTSTGAVRYEIANKARMSFRLKDGSVRLIPLNYICIVGTDSQPRAEVLQYAVSAGMNGSAVYVPASKVSVPGARPMGSIEETLNENCSQLTGIVEKQIPSLNFEGN